MGKFKIMKPSKGKEKTVWLCTGDVLGKGKKQKPCIYAHIEIRDRNIPLFARSKRTKRITELTVFCYKKLQYIHKWVKECNEHQNSTLDRMFIKKNENSLIVK